MSDRVLSPPLNLVNSSNRELIPTDDIAISVRNVGKMYYAAPLPWGSLDVLVKRMEKVMEAIDLATAPR